jgi:hypothetical protein
MTMSQDVNDMLGIGPGPASGVPEGHPPPVPSQDGRSGDPGYSPEGTETKYGALRLASTAYIVLAWLALVFLCLKGLGSCTSTLGGIGENSEMSGELLIEAVSTLLMWALYAGGAFFTCMAFGQGIRLYLDLEANTRKTNQLLEQILGKRR